jgi:hypothetical protein
MRTDSHGWERKAELGHVLEKQKTTVGVSAFTERYCIKCRCGPTAPVLPELRADVRSNSARHFRTCFIKEDIGSPDAWYRFTWMGRKAELGHVLVKLS